MMMLFSLTNAVCAAVGGTRTWHTQAIVSASYSTREYSVGQVLLRVRGGLIQMAVLMVYGELMFRVGLFRDPITLALLIVTWVSHCRKLWNGDSDALKVRQAGRWAGHDHSF